MPEKFKNNFELLSSINLPAIFENTNDSVWAINTKYEILYTNSVFRTAFYHNFKINLVVGTNLLMSLPESIRPIWKSRYDKGLKNESFSFVDEIIGGKSPLFIEVFVNPIVVKEEIIGVLFFAKDITQRKQDELNLRNSQILLKASLESQKGTILFSINTKYEYLFYNKAHEAAMQFAYHKYIEVGMNILDCITSDEDRKIAKQNYDRALNGESHSNIQVFGNKNKAYYESFFNPIRNEDNEIIGATGLARNITERKEFEISLTESEKKLKELNETKDKLFSILGHDLKGPLMNILGFSSILKTKIDDPSFSEKKKMVQSIKSSTETTIRLLDDLLAWAKSKTDLEKIQIEKANLHDLVLNVIETQKSIAKEKNIVLSNKVGKRVEIFADKNIIKTVLRNLISNAIKFTPLDGKVTIEALKKENFTEVSVTDNGVGISETRQTELFEISKNKSTPGTANEKGTGLGLILCKELVEKHKGRIWVESIEGKGSSFKFTLPTHS